MVGLNRIRHNGLTGFKCISTSFTKATALVWAAVIADVISNKIDVAAIRDVQVHVIGVAENLHLDFHFVSYFRLVPVVDVVKRLQWRDW